MSEFLNMEVAKLFLQALRKALPTVRLYQGEDYVHYAQDESHAFDAVDYLAVIFPESHEHVVSIIQIANEFSWPLVPSGGRTGLSGAAIAQNNELVLSLERMNQIIHVDTLNRQITAQAGVSIAQLQKAASDAGLFYPVNYASRDSAQIGGAVATNAGGIRVLRYGMTRNWIAGLKVVTGKGDTLDAGVCLEKDNAGLNWQSLVIGSEGTLAVCTEVVCNLTQPMPSQLSVLLRFDNLAQMLSLFLVLRENLQLNAAEFFCEASLQQVMQVQQLAHPFASVLKADVLQQNFESGAKSKPYYLLIECDAAEQNIEDLGGESLLEKLAALLGDTPCVIAQGLEQAQKLWRYRECISSSINHLKPYKNDLSCQLSALRAWLEALERGFMQSAQSSLTDKLSVLFYGHLGDGNVHINVIAKEAMSDKQWQDYLAVFSDVVKNLSVQYPSSISAEHGIGLLKKELLAFQKTETELALYKSLKQVFDPKGILNPGKVYTE